MNGYMARVFVKDVFLGRIVDEDKHYLLSPKGFYAHKLILGGEIQNISTRKDRMELNDGTSTITVALFKPNQIIRNNSLAIVYGHAEYWKRYGRTRPVIVADEIHLATPDEVYLHFIKVREAEAWLSIQKGAAERIFEEADSLPEVVELAKKRKVPEPVLKGVYMAKTLYQNFQNGNRPK